MPEGLTETDSTKFSDYLAEQMRDPEFAAAYKEVSAVEDAKLAEIRRLEREVVARAKEFTDDTEPRENWDALVAYRELCRAVDALLDFESSHAPETKG